MNVAVTYIPLDQLSQLSSGVKLARVIHHKIRSLSNWMIFMAFSRTKNAPDKHQLFPSLAQPSLPYHALNKVYFTTQNMVVVLHIRQMMMMWGQFWLFGSHERSTDKRGANLGSARLSSAQLGSAQLSLAQLGSAGLNLAQLGWFSSVWLSKSKISQKQAKIVTGHPVNEVTLTRDSLYHIVAKL